MGRLRNLLSVIRYKYLKNISDERKYERFIQEKEKYVKNKSIKSKSCITCIIMLYADNDVTELTNSILSIEQQSGYFPSQIILCMKEKNQLSLQLSKYIENVVLKDIIRIYAGEYNESLCLSAYFTIVKCGDILSPMYLYEMENEIRATQADIIYSDEDEICLCNNQRRNPYFKPDWSPDTLLSFNYIGYSSCVCRNFLKDEHIQFDTAYTVYIDSCMKKSFAIWNYDHILKLTEAASKIVHVSKVLYHKTNNGDNLVSEHLVLNESTDTKKDTQTIQAINKIRAAALERRHIEGKIVPNQRNTLGNVQYNTQSELASIIILTKDHNDMFEKCVNSLLELTKYVKYEIIVVDNGSRKESRERYEQFCKQHQITYVWCNIAFNYSYMCNLGANYAKGDAYVFLNDDTQIIQEDWLAILTGQAIQKKTALVGAKLLYPDCRTIQHCGILNQRGNYTHAFYQMDQFQACYHNLDNTVMDCFSVTGACLCIAKEKFEMLGGWSEELPIAYNDVELGIKALNLGLHNVVRNDVVLLHHESISRGKDCSLKKRKRLSKEKMKLKQSYSNLWNQDPYYNSNLSMYTQDYDINY